ncbi:unnamed protein product [Chrysodeixis includens]|uniref:Uncharacterized protein n=1 Tax=Chrysodeixis includens TaxID=689277 RepID=A0A9P0BRM8_CHRIL|nr:unnamed protein product [Chrysodeixis includens]
MESHGDEENNYSDVIESLMNMFGNVMSKDVISAVVESCSGDLSLSADAIMDITGDGNVINVQDEDPADNENPTVATTQPSSPSISYSTVAQVPQSTGAIPKTTQSQQQQKPPVWSEQIKNILNNHNEGYRILIIMRGLPGSGKTYLAKQLIDMTVGPNYASYKAHIFSTDDFFMVRGQYQHDKYKLPEAHDWNQRRVAEATKMGVSPVIVDNTNVELWETEPYLKFGVRNGYIIEVVEPTTPWAKKIYQLAKKNTHNVPLAALKRMSENYCLNLTGTSLKQAYGLSYPSNMVPPVKRNVPALIASPEIKPDSVIKELRNSSPVDIATNVAPASSSVSTVTHPPQQQTLSIENEEQQNYEPLIVNDLIEIVEDQKPLLTENDDEDENVDLLAEEQEKQRLYLEAQKRLEEIEKVEHEWENGEKWDSGEQASALKIPRTNKATESQVASIFEAKPQRQSLNSSPRLQNSSQESQDFMMQTVNDCQDWSQISMFMPPWTDTAAPSSTTNEKLPIQTMSSSTCMELGDTDVNGKLKVITATSRNINEFHISMGIEKIPEKRMLDKSSMTNETIITESFRCVNEEKHFVAFRKLFPNLARSDLRDIFEKCCGDVNWAVEIVLDGMNNKLLKQVDKEELSDEELETTEQCQCLAKYNIIPNANSIDVPTSDAVENKPKDENNPVAVVSVSQKKKRDATLSDDNIQIKRQIEQNVVISDDHYSKHCLMIRKIRRGEPTDKNLEERNTSEEPVDATNFDSANASNIDSTEAASVTGDTDDENECNFDNGDRLVTVNLGFEFVGSLDDMYGRTGMEYPDNILPRITLPLSALNELNALWMESLMAQLDEHARKTAAMVQQDEEFARQIALKEAEMSLAGKEPEVPDFKEIMDMELALATYQKDISEWKSNIPTNLAAKMTRDKLFNLFPDVEEDTLSELLMAHDNNFQATVEVLLLSTGRGDVLEKKNGVNKFVMQKEIDKKEKILKKKKKELSEAEWPLLSPNHKVDMATVDAYREEADQHLQHRNQNFQKAQDAIRRGMTQVANYYSDIANFHKQKYEQANGFAVASLMQFHALNNPDCTTIDLHFLRVKEAKELLDIFIDTHISKLRESSTQRSLILFFITGRGSHSQGRARIKPATINRLKERGLSFVLRNPGLISARINKDTKLTYQISVP